jgi:hypothetical protein
MKMKLVLKLKTKFIKQNWKQNSSNEIGNKIQMKLKTKLTKWNLKQNSNKIETKLNKIEKNQMELAMKLKTKFIKQNLNRIENKIQTKIETSARGPWAPK